MNFQEYTKRASKTAFYPRKVKDFRLAYLALKMNGETGELVEALKLYDLDRSTGVEILRLNILKEAGDLLWYTGQMAKLLGLYFNSFGFNNYFQDNMYAMHDYVDIIKSSTRGIAEIAGKCYRDQKGVIDNSFRGITMLYLERILKALAYLAVVHNTTLENIAVINLEKVEDRMKRGKQGGSGNDR